MIEQLTMDSMRRILSEEIHKIQEGSTTAANVNAISNATGKILSTIRLQMEYAKLTGAQPAIPMLEAPRKPRSR